MKKIYLFLLFGLLLAACVKDDDKQPILVTDIVMPAAGTVFNPGDKVTISAQGFQTDDEIMFEIYWPLPDEPALNYPVAYCPSCWNRLPQASPSWHPGTIPLQLPKYFCAAPAT